MRPVETKTRSITAEIQDKKKKSNKRQAWVDNSDCAFIKKKNDRNMSYSKSIFHLADFFSINKSLKIEPPLEDGVIGCILYILQYYRFCVLVGV